MLKLHSGTFDNCDLTGFGDRDRLAPDRLCRGPSQRDCTPHLPAFAGLPI
jgi:hypothetical protein